MEIGSTVLGPSRFCGIVRHGFIGPVPDDDGPVPRHVVLAGQVVRHGLGALQGKALIGLVGTHIIVIPLDADPGVPEGLCGYAVVRSYSSVGLLASQSCSF